MIVSMIAAVAQNGTIGRQNRLPWHIADDMQFFARTTKGHVVVTGRKNFEAMGGPLPERTNIVVTRRADYEPTGAKVARSVEEALIIAHALGEMEVFVIGGAQLYAAAKPYVHRFFRTRVLADVEGDVKYSDDDWDGWETSSLGGGQANAHNEHAYEIELLTRLGAPLSYGVVPTQ